MTSKSFGYQAGLLSFIRPATTTRLLPKLGSVPAHRLSRAAGVSAAGMIGSPLRLVESVKHGRAIDETVIDQPPVFIIGHWRSGTTHLHNLMSQDPQYGCVRMFQALAPDCSLTTKSWLPQMFEKVFPTKRPMDNLEWPMDAPQEEEIPLTKLSPYSWYLQFLFPQQAEAMFNLGVLFDGSSRRPEAAQEEFKAKYLRILKTAALHERGRRLLLKNPVNTARIPLLLELFPDAKFVSINRSPYEVFPSTMRLHREILELTALQDYDEALIESNVLSIYEKVMRRYLGTRHLIPHGNLCEVSYADLDADPTGTVASIYQQLGLAGHEAAEAPIRTYVESQAEYKKNSFSLSDREIEVIEDRWRFAFDAFGYARGGVGAGFDLSVGRG